MNSRRVTIDSWLDRRPRADVYRNLWDWLHLKLGIRLSTSSSCKGHVSPYHILQYKYRYEPHTTIVHGPRGGGKSMTAALGAHVECRWRPGYKVRILGGSKDQSRQVYEAIQEKVYTGQDGHRDAAPFLGVTAEQARYKNGSHVKILAASQKQVHGPHIPYLILDELDEQDEEIVEAAVGMVQEYPERGFRPRIDMLSTWHNVGGLMSRKLEEAEEKQIPVFRFCIFEVMERCPDAVSGPRLENCPSCPIYEHCWADRFEDRSRPPKAKLAGGHYTVSSVFQKALNLGERQFASDFLCIGPRVHGLWFKNYDDRRCVSEEWAEYDPRYNVYVSIDYGPCTGAVFFQVKRRLCEGRAVEDCTVFADYYADGASAQENAREIRRLAHARCEGRMTVVSMDSAANSREGSGLTGRGEYYRAGIQEVVSWPKVQNKIESLAIIDSFLKTAAGTRHLYLHPRCTWTRRALSQYRRNRVGNQWSDRPKDPQHPEEELIDALSGHLNLLYPYGRGDVFGGRAIMVAPNVIG